MNPDSASTPPTASPAHVPADSPPSERLRELFARVYDEMRSLAAVRISQLAPGQTLQATALVHEVFVRMSNRAEPDWESESHLLGLATVAMRDILVESARRKSALKHGGGRKRVDFDEQVFIDHAADTSHLQVLEIDAALRDMETHDPELAQIASMRIFAGLTIDQIAAALRIPTRTVERRWQFVRVWLHRALRVEPRSTPD